MTTTKILPPFAFAGTRTYRNGEVVEYNGEHVRDADGTILFHLVVVDDSYRIGHKLSTYTAPEAR